MTKNIEKYRLEERVFLSNAKHRGNAELVAKEVGIPYEFAVRICNKLKKKQDRDVNILIASHIMGTVMLGRESRMQYYTTMINALEGRDSIELSVCHNGLMVCKMSGEPLVCLKCGLPAKSYIEHQAGIYHLRMELLKELREEDNSLVEFADKMGYTQRQQVPPMVYNDERKYLFLGQGTNPKQHQGQQEIPEKQKLLLEEADKLSPIERTALINRIQSGLEETFEEEEQKEETNGNTPKP
jgi:hypothetical protein